jgi:hypothetical protein
VNYNLGGLPNNLLKGGTNGANFVLALFELNLALSCAQRDLQMKLLQNLHFISWVCSGNYQLITYLLLSLFQGDDLTTED